MLSEESTDCPKFYAFKTFTHLLRTCFVLHAELSRPLIHTRSPSLVHTFPLTSWERLYSCEPVQLLAVFLLLSACLFCLSVERFAVPWPLSVNSHCFAVLSSSWVTRSVLLNLNWWYLSVCTQRSHVFLYHVCYKCFLQVSLQPKFGKKKALLASGRKEAVTCLFQAFVVISIGLY